MFASNAYVTPCIAVVSGWPQWVPQPEEVDRVLRMEVQDLVMQETPASMVIERGPLQFAAPRMIVEDHSVWGATAVILGELQGRLRRIGSQLESSCQPSDRTVEP